MRCTTIVYLSKPFFFLSFNPNVIGITRLFLQYEFHSIINFRTICFFFVFTFTK